MFDTGILDRVANVLLQNGVLDVLPEQVKVSNDLHLRPYYGDKDETDRLYRSEAERGTTALHAYADKYQPKILN